MAKIAVKILPETEKEKEGGFYLKYIKGFDRTSDGAFGSSAIAEAEITNEIWRMADMVRKNVDSCFTTVIDGNVAREMPCQARTIAGGDGKSASIAAASILAKVSRDRYMQELDREYPAYGFAKHKGYGTKQHNDAILANGPCPHHRLSFLSGLVGLMQMPGKDE